jgi:DNA-binding transcriptional ArsR family regulator
MSNPLEELLLDADEVDQAQLAQGLKGVLGVDRKTGRVVLKPGFNALDTRRRCLAFLLGAKVARLLQLVETEAVAPKDLQKATGMPQGTVRPKLSQLYDERIVSKTSSGSYYVDSHQVSAALEVLKGKDEAR